MKKFLSVKLFVFTTMCLLLFVAKGFSQAFKNASLEDHAVYAYVPYLDKISEDYEIRCKYLFCVQFSEDDYSVNNDIKVIGQLSGDYLKKEIEKLFNKISAWKDNPLISSPLRAKVRQKLEVYKEYKFYYSASEIKKREAQAKAEQQRIQDSIAELQRIEDSIWEAGREERRIQYNIWAEEQMEERRIQDSIRAEQDSIQAEDQRVQDSIRAAEYKSQWAKLQKREKRTKRRIIIVATVAGTFLISSIIIGIIDGIDKINSDYQ
ncbi:MAG: hypothetical protein FWF51_12815 [Chitinivibrionia bacterium]|nr:hypothetical protein [Chitinivibrionia bacterium]